MIRYINVQEEKKYCVLRQDCYRLHFFNPSPAFDNSSFHFDNSSFLSGRSAFRRANFGSSEQVGKFANWQVGKTQCPPFTEQALPICPLPTCPLLTYFFTNRIS
jgi:hypothetical protein